MDFSGIESKVKEVMERIQNDDQLKEEFKQDPVKTIEGLLGVDLPDEMVMAFINNAKEKVNFDTIGDNINDAFESIKNMFK